MKAMALSSQNACPPTCEAAGSGTEPCLNKALTAHQEIATRLQKSTPEEALQQFGDLVRCIRSSLVDNGLPYDTYLCAPKPHYATMMSVRQ